MNLDEIRIRDDELSCQYVAVIWLISAVDLCDVTVSVCIDSLFQCDLKKHHMALVDCLRLEQKGNS